MRLSRFLIVVFAAAVAAPALSAPLAPTKVSDVVTLMPNAGGGANGACGVVEQRVDAAINTVDGSLVQFTIPPRRSWFSRAGRGSGRSAAGT